jgi:hypothetical protein
MELSFNAIANLLLGLLAIPVSAGEKMDFHARKLLPGQTLPFGWRFDTYATQQVKFAVVTMDGKPAQKALTIQVGPLEDRNYRMAGQ